MHTYTSKPAMHEARSRLFGGGTRMPVSGIPGPRPTAGGSPETLCWKRVANRVYCLNLQAILADSTPEPTPRGSLPMS